MQGISLYQLRLFMAVARNASFSKAAVECNIAQTTISQQILNLEDMIGFTLFDRAHSHVGLTDLGTIFYNRLWDHAGTGCIYVFQTGHQQRSS